mgnify:CR=1 FL=1
MLYLTQRVETPAQATASVTLPIDVRVKSRIKVTLNDGRQAGLLLPRGLVGLWKTLRAAQGGKA